MAIPTINNKLTTHQLPVVNNNVQSSPRPAASNAYKFVGQKTLTYSQPQGSINLA